MEIFYFKWSVHQYMMKKEAGNVAQTLNLWENSCYYSSQLLPVEGSITWFILPHFVWSQLRQPLKSNYDGKTLVRKYILKYATTRGGRRKKMEKGSGIISLPSLTAFVDHHEEWAFQRMWCFPHCYRQQGWVEGVCTGTEPHLSCAGL